MIINDNTVEQINIALLDLEKKISGIVLDAKAIKSLETIVDGIRRSLNETKVGLDSGATYNINITGNASTATYANTAGSASTADSASTASSADSATKDGNGDIISTTYQKVDEKDAKAGYVNCDQTANGSYILVATVNNGAVTYSWESRV